MPEQDGQQLVDTINEKIDQAAEFAESRRWADASSALQEVVALFAGVLPELWWYERKHGLALLDLALCLEAEGKRSKAVQAMRESQAVFQHVIQDDARFLEELATTTRELRRLRLVRLGLSPRRRQPELHLGSLWLNE